MRGPSPLLLARALCAVLVASTAGAQEGVQLEQFEPRAPGGSILNVATPRLLPPGGVSAGLWLSYADGPLSLRPVAEGDARSGGDVVDAVTRVELVGAVGLIDGLALSIAAPAELGGPEGDYGIGGRSAADLAGAGLGDVRVGVTLAPGRWLWGEGVFDVGLELTGWLPTGSTARLAGEGGLRYEPRLLASLAAGRWALAADVGWHVRERSTLFSFVNESGLRWRVGAEAPTPWDRLDVVASVFGAGHLAEQPDPLDVRQTDPTDAYDPVEALGAVRARLPWGLVAHAGGGAGLTDGIGAPSWRVIAGLGWTHPAPDAAAGGASDDRDGDGIDDLDDVCPTAPETVNGIRDEDGCPEAPDLSPIAVLDATQGALADTDGDGIADEVDRCPSAAEDVDGFEDGDGCPDADNDGDGIADGADRCPQVAGVEGGCVAVGPDADADGVGDALDACPHEPESWNGVRDGDGCPEVAEGAEVLWATLPPLPRAGDADGDGVADSDDACPEAPEDRDGFADDDGCPELDQDGDGIDDAVDRCPAAAEVVNGFEDGDGCPDVGPDGDGDGVADVFDVCPHEPEAPDGIRDDDGCPEGAPPDEPEAAPVVARAVLPPLAPRVDLDGDGIIDDDRCPTTPEDMDGFEDADGCPEADDDEDGVPDALDGCQRVAETPNFYNDDDGCPDAAPREMAGLSGVVESIQFKVGRSDLRPSAMPVLRRVARVMRQNPRLRLQIDGHTDSTGERERNFVLSNDRAAAVRGWLINEGVAPERMSSFGYGPDRPVASNADLQGRYRNRRVELSYSEPGGIR